MKAWLSILFSISIIMQASSQTPAEVEKLTSGREERLAWWNDARFGMFIHWGLFSELAGEYDGRRINGLGEWIMYNAKISVDEYRKLAERFNPTYFDADAWVRLARDAGMKYIVITAKHCDGFAMFHSKASKYNIVDATPYHRDPLQEISAACRKYGLRFGVYYSHNWDWNEPDAMGDFNSWDFPDTAKKDVEAYYRNKSLPQVRELLTQYAPSLIWFDAPSDITRRQSFEFLKTVRQLCKDCIINNRIGEEKPGEKFPMGDYGTPEQHIPEKVNGPFEVCMTLNDTWGFKYYDRNWKSPKEIVGNLINTASKGGNYLLNIGPDAKGRVPSETIKILKIIGDWLDENGEAIYGTQKSPLGKLPFSGARCTARPGKLYIHLLDVPEGNELLIPGIRNDITKVYYLKDSTQQVPYRKTSSNELYINLDLSSLRADVLNNLSMTLVIEYAGDLKVDLADRIVDPSSLAYFDPLEAKISGDSLQYKMVWFVEEGYGVYEATKWKDGASMSWPFRTVRPGTFDVEIEYGADSSCAGNAFDVCVGDQVFPVKALNTGDWRRFQKQVVGRVRLDALSSGKVMVTARKQQTSKLINLKSVTLLPVDK